MQESVKVDRQLYIGGSDIPAILGVSKFKSRYQLLRQKAGLEDDEFNGNIYTEYGIKLEPKIRDYINALYETNFIEGKHYEAIEGESIGIRCHTDGENKNTILEIKTKGEEDIDDMIDKSIDRSFLSIRSLLLERYYDYLVQTLFYMMKAKKEIGIIAVYHRPSNMDENFDPKRLRCYWFSIDEFKEVCERINIEIESFITDLNALKKDPFLSEEDLLPVDIRKIADDILILENKLKEYKEMQDSFESLKIKLREAMERYGVLSFRTANETLITAVSAVPATTKIETVFDLDTFTAEHPRLAKKYTSEKVKTVNGRKGYLKITYPKED